MPEQKDAGSRTSAGARPRKTEWPPTTKTKSLVVDVHPRTLSENSEPRSTDQKQTEPQQSAQKDGASITVPLGSGPHFRSAVVRGVLHEVYAAIGDQKELTVNLLVVLPTSALEEDRCEIEAALLRQTGEIASVSVSCGPLDAPRGSSVDQAANGSDDDECTGDDARVAEVAGNTDYWKTVCDGQAAS